MIGIRIFSNVFNILGFSVRYIEIKVYGCARSGELGGYCRTVQELGV